MNCIRCKVQITKKRQIPFRDDFNDVQKKAWETMKDLVCIDCAKEYKEAGAFQKLNMAQQSVFWLKPLVPNGNLTQVREALSKMTPQQRRKVRKVSTEQLLNQGYSQELIDEAFDQAGR